MELAIGRLVAEAKASGAVIRTGAAAKRLAAENPGASPPLRTLAEEIARQAITAGVPIQFTSPD